MKHILQIATLLGLAVLPLSADIIYNVTVNTSAYLGRSGYLDFQLGSGPDSQRALVAVGGFSADGVLNAAGNQISGNVTGTLPGVLTLTNTQQFNDDFAAFTFGRSIAFALDFSGPAINAPVGTSAYGSPFYFGLYGSAQRPLGPSDAFGNALLIQINTNGTTTPQTYNSAVNILSAVPEPGPLGLLGIGLLAAALTSVATKAVKAHGQSRHHRQLT